MFHRALVVEDSPQLRRGIERHLRSVGTEVIATESITRAVELLTRGPSYDAMLLDLGLPEGSGLSVLERLPASVPRPTTIVMTGDARMDAAVGALRVGAADFLVKPFSMETLDAALARALTARGLARTGNVLEDQSPDHEAARAWRALHAPRMLGASASLLGAIELLRRVAPTDCPVLLRGETGTGKELAARALHAASRRAGHPFVAVNCAAIPESLIESELFGHARGAYTGAARERAGHFVTAHGGTLLLDEIAEMPLVMQGKLLRVLQEHEVVPVGEDRAVPIDVRVIAATNCDLDEMVERGRFRADLLYRLDVVRVELPPLRARPGDLAVLVPPLVSELNRRLGTSVHTVEEPAMQALRAYGWPGNLRQLTNALERALVVRGDGPLRLRDLPEKVIGGGGRAPRSSALELPAGGLDLRAELDHYELEMLRQALDRTNGNRKRAAELLGLNRTTLVEKLKRRGFPCASADEEDSDSR